MKRKFFTPADDALIREWAIENGPDNWEEIGILLKRTARQVRDRYEHYLSPKVNNSPWEPEEDALLKSTVKEMGRKWTSMLNLFPGRTTVSLKNRWKYLSQKEDCQSPYAYKIQHHKKNKDDRQNVKKFDPYPDICDLLNDHSKEPAFIQ